MLKAFSIGGLFLACWQLITVAICLWATASWVVHIATRHARSESPKALFIFAGILVGVWPLLILAAGAVTFFFGAILGPGMDTGLALIKYSESIMRDNSALVPLSMFAGAAIILADFYMSGMLLGFRRPEYIKG